MPPIRSIPGEWARQPSPGIWTSASDQFGFATEASASIICNNPAESSSSPGSDGGRCQSSRWQSPGHSSLELMHPWRECLGWALAFAPCEKRVRQALSVIAPPAASDLPAIAVGGVYTSRSPSTDATIVVRGVLNIVLNRRRSTDRQSHLPILRHHRCLGAGVVGCPKRIR